MISFLPRLRAAGLRSTGPRQAILTYFQSAPRPVSARTVYEVLKRRGIDRSSVFRTLQTLARLEILTMTESPSHETLYEFQKKHHHHLQCLSCGKLKPIDCFLSTTREQSLQRTAGFASIRHQADLYGICASCAKQSSGQ